MGEQVNQRIQFKSHLRELVGAEGAEVGENLARECLVDLF
jgi:hypothetical protein